jgi:tetratricopeptide (TPR) repeat protein
MVRSLFLLMLSFCVGVPATAQAPFDWGLCRDFGRGASEAKLNACTALIESGKRVGGDLANIHVMRGRIHFFLKGEIDRALAEYSEALRIEPRNCAAFYFRSIVSASENNADDAIAHLSTAISFCPTVGVYHRQRGVARYVKLELDQAISDLDEALRLDPDDATALMIRSMAKQSKGDQAGSQSDKRALEELLQRNTR